MRKAFYYISAVTFVTIVFTSCAPKLVGTWSIVRYETKQPNQQAVSQNNIGTMTFMKNGDGEKNISYTASGSVMNDNSRFGWYTTGPYLGIESPGSNFSKTWVIVTNKRREQKWRSSDASGVQVLELKK